MFVTLLSVALPVPPKMPYEAFGFCALAQQRG
jgi:hypothetical protein